MTDFALNGATRADRGLFANLKASLARRRVYRQTRNELSMLSDRDLADIGFSRCDVPAIAREHARQLAA
jgi:uncharacterized protein YjiS (DUF1127 family)